MPFLVRLVVLLLAAFPLGAGAQIATPAKIVSWNLEWFPGHRLPASPKEADKHMAAAKTALKKIDPDIFVGIEMHDWEAFRNLCSAVPGLTPLVVSNFRDPVTGAIRPQQIGIAAKLVCRASGWQPWQASIPGIPRGFAYAALEDPSTHKLILVYGNHLKSNREGDTAEGEELIGRMRNEQATLLLRQIEESKVAFGADHIRGWVVAGDMNTNHDGEFPQCHVIEKFVGAGFLDTWAKTPRKNRASWRGDYQHTHKPTTLDYILTRGFGDQLRASLIDAPRNVSDHYPITLTLP